MSDMKRRFASLDRIPVPDLWRDISRREPAEIKLGPSWRRVAVAALALLVAAAGIGVATWAFIGNRNERRVVRPVPITAKSNGQIVFVGGTKESVSSGQGDGLYVINPDGRGLRKIRSGGMEPAWSPEGGRVAYVIAGASSGWELHVVDALGKHDTLVMKEDGAIRWPSWSPDGKRIAVSVSGLNLPSGLYVVNADGTDPHPITDPPVDSGQAAWSPDGTRFVFVGVTTGPPHSTSLFVMGEDGSAAHRLTTSSSFESSPRWSPDGAQLAFIRNGPVIGGPPSTSSVDVSNANGTEEHEVYSCTDCLGVDRVAWSPDGGKLIFSLSQNSVSRLWIMDADGRNRHRIDTGSLQACCADWQPVAVSAAPPTGPTPIPTGHLSPTPRSDFLGDVAYDIGFGRDARVWLMHADGSGAHEIATGSDPAWSPDGTLIAYRTHFQGDTSDLAVMDTRGSNQRTLAQGVRFTIGFGLGGAPAWSPDSTTIAFAAYEGLLLVDSNGGSPRLLTHTTDCVEYDPSWSPDGTQIVFGVGCTEQLSDTEAGIAIVSTDGTDRHLIIRHDSGQSGGFPPGAPDWSSDGLHIAFDTVSGEGNYGTIFIVNPDGSNLIEFVSGVMPTWSADGSSIAFSFQDLRNDLQADIYAIGIDGKDRRRLTSGKSAETNPAWQPIFGTP